jgi:hypothetical protein
MEWGFAHDMSHSALRQLYLRTDRANTPLVQDVTKQQAKDRADSRIDDRQATITQFLSRPGTVLGSRMAMGGHSGDPTMTLCGCPPVEPHRMHELLTFLCLGQCT